MLQKISILNKCAFEVFTLKKIWSSTNCFQHGYKTCFLSSKSAY